MNGMYESRTEAFVKLAGVVLAGLLLWLLAGVAGGLVAVWLTS